MTNRVTLAQATEMPLTEVANLPIEQIALLLEDVAELKSHAKRVDDHIYNAMRLRFADGAAEARRAKGTDTGTVRLTDGNYTVIADLPKKILWDQAEVSVVQTVVSVNRGGNRANRLPWLQPRYVAPPQLAPGICGRPRGPWLSGFSVPAT